MFHKDANRRRTLGGRALSLFLAAVLLLGTAPGLTVNASAANWADPYLDQLVDWGVMRADQTRNPDSPMTRAEFMAVVNRAYGYKEMGPIPFTDVKKSDWFYDDVAIAYTAGYMKGTSGTTASPNMKLTREQAVCILGRNMMMKETPGEDLAFSDSRSISGWARGMVKTAVNSYIVTGYPDNSFHPGEYVTKGQMAALVTRCIGTPVSERGSFELGDVSGNVTVTSPNVTLRNTTVSGDLYVSGGVGLGGIKLENVNVLGRIVVSGTGESENGSASVIMRNVNANELLVDNMRKKYVTVRADGITEIANTIVRTNAYLEDNNTDEKGLLNISLEGDPGTRLDLAGRIKRVTDRTTDSFVQVAKGSVQSLTVDEDAVNAVVQINRNTHVKELNLDVAANVNGEGDVGKLNINAPGSTVTMLPDEIYIRPGITGNVNGVVMDSAAAEESALDPRILSGYPAASDVAPTGFRADFSGNKKGTVYWAVSGVSDGSIGADSLITPPSYGSKALRGGSVGLPAGDTVGSAQVSGLTVGGSYYLSAVLVDGRGERSPVKVISFTTPDNTVPAFAQGYPYMSLISNNLAQVTVMPTKTCKLYYAVLLKGAPAPTAAEMRSASVTGNLGYGIVDVVKNTERVINVSNRLQELKDYTLYLWLTDADGVNSSAVVPVQFKTVDKTAPEFAPDPDPGAAVEEKDSVKLTAGLNETGTIYWVAVEKGKAYPPINYASNPLDKDNVLDPETKLPISSSLTSEFAKNQVKNHSGSAVVAFNSVPVPKADTEVPINVDKLKEATVYDFYYVAQDSANNFSKEVKKITIKTKDTVGPVVTQCFRDATQGKDILIPKSGDEVVLKFNEDIKANGMGGLLDLSKSDLKKALKASFKLYYLDAKGDPQPVAELDPQTTAPTTWVDYGKVTVRQGRNGAEGIEVVFDPAKDAVKLVSGRTYYFELTGITDLSDNNPKGFEQANDPVLNYDTIGKTKTEHVLGMFTVAPASVKLSKPANDAPIAQPDWVENTYLKDDPANTDAINKAGYERGGSRDDNGTDIDLARVDGTFYVDPESTSEMGDTYFYDIVLFSEKAMDYDVYYRVLDPTAEYNPLNNKPTSTSRAETAAKYFDDYRLRTDDTAGHDGWAYLGNVKSNMISGDPRAVSGLNRDAERAGYKASIDRLTQLKKLSQDVRYEFAISVTKLNGSSDFDTWGDKYNVYIDVIAGSRDRVDRVIEAGNVTEETMTSKEGISVISDPLYITMDFTKFDAPPGFTVGPKLTPNDGSTGAKMTFALSNPGTLYYVVEPQDQILDGTKVTTKVDIGKSDDSKKLYIKSGTAIEEDMTFEGDKIHWPEGTPEGDKTWDNLLWQAVSTQTGVTNPGNLEYYSVNVPANTTISQHRDVQRYYYEDGTDEVSLKLKNGQELEEGAKYYIYIVVRPEDSSRLSEVYLYNFTSGETRKPIIGLRDNQHGDVMISTAGGDSTSNRNVPADLDWVVFTQKQGEDALQSDITIPPGITGYSTMTFLKALQTAYSAETAYGGENNIPKVTDYGSDKDGYTVFDVFATTVEKNAVRGLIFDDNALGRVSSGEAKTREPSYSVTANWEDAADFKNPPDRLQRYLILVVGHHKDSKTDNRPGGGGWAAVDSFRVLEDVRVENMERPIIKDVTGDVTYSSGKLSGSVYVLFDRQIRWVEDGKSVYNQLTGGTNSTRGPYKGLVGVLYNMSPEVSYFTTTSVKGTGNSITLPFTNVDIGIGETKTVILLDGGDIYSAEGTPASDKIKITFGLRALGEGNAIGKVPCQPYCEVSFGTGGGSDEIKGGQVFVDP